MSTVMEKEIDFLELLVVHRAIKLLTRKKKKVYIKQLFMLF